MSRRPTSVAVVAFAFFLLPSEAGAVKYLSLEEAIKAYIPEGTKIIKTTKRLSAEQRRVLEDDYGWKPDQETYVFYVGKKGEEPVSTVFVVPEIFNTCFHKYAVGLRADGSVIDTAIVELSCPRAFKINRQSFLGQFKHKKHSDPLTTKSDIDAVTGATLSSEATATATRKAVSLHNLFFGGGQKVLVAANVKEARAKAAGLIQKAIETGETLKKDGKGDGSAQLPEEK